MNKPIKRGDIFSANLDPVIGSEQGNIRPVLVVQNDKGNHYSPTIVIVPITSKPGKNLLPTHVTIPKHCGLTADSLALTEQIRTVDRSRLYEYIGRIDYRVQEIIDKALAISIGINKKLSAKGEMFELCLCHRCENSFLDNGYVVVKKGWQDVKENCDLCKQRLGIIFGIFSSIKNSH